MNEWLGWSLSEPLREVFSLPVKDWEIEEISESFWIEVGTNMWIEDLVKETAINFVSHYTMKKPQKSAAKEEANTFLEHYLYRDLLLKLSGAQGQNLGTEAKHKKAGNIAESLRGFLEKRTFTITYAFFKEVLKASCEDRDSSVPLSGGGCMILNTHLYLPKLSEDIDCQQF